MKLMKVCILMAITTGLAFAPGSHDVRQTVVWPAGYNIDGVHWEYWDLYNSTDINDYLDENSVGSNTLYNPTLNEARWYVDVANFPSGDNWLDGDTNICLGSIDSAYQADPAGYGSNINHNGWYWIFSDTLYGIDEPQTWEPKDTLRKMPEPYIDYLTHVDSVIILIPNPAETRRVDQTEYDVLGYWLILDTTKTGTPDAYADSGVILGFAPVQGGSDDITHFKYKLRDYYTGSLSFMILHHAYYIVARPSFNVGPGKCPGHRTYYTSGNFTLEWLDIAEYNDPTPTFSFALFVPSIVGSRTTINYSLAKITRVAVSLYNSSGQLMRTLVDGTKPAGTYTVEFNREALPNGVYFVELKAGNYSETKKLILVQ